ncbi:MAG: enoyl-CoA hydratase/isomerase family protein [Kiloniellaceae bacterium]
MAERKDRAGQAEESIELERAGAVATLWLNRPARRNAFDLAMWGRLGDLVADLAGDGSLRCLVLRGRGGAFAAGADISEFPQKRHSAAQAADYARIMDRATEAVADCPAPTLAVIEGPCVGGGLELAVQCDLRLATETARFGIPINRIGHCLPYPAMIALVELAGRAAALEILLEGRILTAEEALAKGLVTRVVPDDALEAEASAMVTRIADGAPLAARWHKQLAKGALRPETLTEEDWRVPLLSCDTADYREGIRAFLAKEKPVFRGA